MEKARIVFSVLALALNGCGPQESNVGPTTKTTNQLTEAQQAASFEKIATPYGELEIRKAEMDAKGQSTDGGIFFKGTPLLADETFSGDQHIAIDMNSKSLQGTYQLADETAVLVLDGGNGSSCPARYFFISVSAAGAKASSQFGTCSDLIEATPQANSVEVTMPGFWGPFESTEKQRKAAGEKHTFIYKAGSIHERPRAEPTTKPSNKK